MDFAKIILSWRVMDLAEEAANDDKKPIRLKPKLPTVFGSITSYTGSLMPLVVEEMRSAIINTFKLMLGKVPDLSKTVPIQVQDPSSAKRKGAGFLAGIASDEITFTVRSKSDMSQALQDRQLRKDDLIVLSNSRNMKFPASTAHLALITKVPADRVR